MARHTGPVLVDTNAIIECWRLGAWNALAGGYSVETVGACFVETQTGFQRRSPERLIDSKVLAETLKAVHPVGDSEMAAALVRDPQIATMDEGERMLWAHALARLDAWVLCGPDKATLRAAIRLGLKDRLVSLEGLLRDVGYPPRIELRLQHTQKWLEQTLVQLAQLERK